MYLTSYVLVLLTCSNVFMCIVAEMVLADLQRAPLLKRCVLEAIRLHSPGTIARRVVKSFTLHVYYIGSCLYHLM